MDKKVVCRLKPGTLIELTYLDEEPEVVMLLRKPIRQNGDISLLCFYPSTGDVNSHATHQQVSHVYPYWDFQFPQPVSDSDRRFKA